MQRMRPLNWDTVIVLHVQSVFSRVTTIKHWNTCMCILIKTSNVCLTQTCHESSTAPRLPLVSILLWSLWFFFALRGEVNRSLAGCTHDGSKMQPGPCGACLLDEAVWLRVMVCEQVIERAGLVPVPKKSEESMHTNMCTQTVMCGPMQNTSRLRKWSIHPEESHSVRLPGGFVNADRFSTFSSHHCPH